MTLDHPPVLLGKSSPSDEAHHPRVVEKKDGYRYRRHFAFVENRVRLSGEERIETPGQTAPEPSPTLLASEKVTPPAQDSFYGSLKQRIWRLLGR